MRRIPSPVSSAPEIATGYRTGMTAVSYGYDRVRFIKPVLVGDTITATYTIAEIDEETLKTYADIKIVNQSRELCTVARHILKFIV